MKTLQMHRRHRSSRKCTVVCCAAALLVVSIAGGFRWVASHMHYRRHGGTQQSHQQHNSHNDNKSNTSKREPYRPNEATYIDGAFSKILKSRDRRDSLAHPRKSGRGSPRDTLGSSDGDGNVVVGAGLRVDAKIIPVSTRRQVVVPAYFPRVVSCTSAKSHARVHLRVPKKMPRGGPTDRNRRVPWTRGQQRRQDYLKDEAYYDDDDHMAEDPYAGYPECVPMHEWQTASYPTCNALHTMELGEAVFVANGFFRDVWAIDVGPEQVAVKTLRLRDSSKLDYDARNYHRHNVDAIVHERLTASPRVMNIFGFCGMSVIVEFASGRDLGDALSEGDTFTKKERFKTALEITQAVSDLHNFNHKVPAIAHSDIWHSQFVKTERGFVLSDFNRAQFLFWNTTSNASSCPYYYQHSNGYPFRSAEEYSYEAQTEKIDVYSVGNVLFSLLMDKWPYEDLYKEKNTDAVSKRIIRGDRDTLSTELLESTDPIDVAIRTAMNMCWVHDWRERYNAKEVASFLMGEKRKVGID